ncbi:MAG TPA: hypothetical protein VGC97_04690, partial [Pyrinomonadaceae bacterium]
MMKKLFIAISLLLFLATFNFAQTNTADWQTYRGNSEDFTAEFPAQPKTSEIKNPKGGYKEQIGDLYKSYFNKTFYFVIACKSTACQQFEVVQNLKFKARNAENSQFTEKTLDDSVIETSFVDSEGFFQKIRQLKTDKIYFIVQTISEAPGSEDAERFFNSFRLNAADEKVLKAKQEKFRERLVTEPFQITPPTNTKTPAPSPTASNSSTTDKPVAKSVEILTKPRANYTDAARIYEISGEVVLRVTFSANEQVGSIMPLKKLPFGLTENAIAAAKGITFKPA